MKRLAIAGAGLTGAVIARSLAEHSSDWEILVFEGRDHVAGNSHTARDPVSGVMEHVHGPHIFNTNHEDVLGFVARFGTWIPHVNRVKASNIHGIFSMPINLHTINQFFGQRLRPEEARAFLAAKALSFDHPPANFEEQALSLIGRELYEAFFLGYTRKQWGCDPRELPADILKRLPVRFNYNDSFYATRFQQMPRDGYTALVDALLDHPRIRVLLRTPFTRELVPDFDQVVYTGAIDAFFDFAEGRLGYRTVTFERRHFDGDYQGNAVINYTDESVDYTRVHQHNNFAPWESHARSLVLTERSRETSPGDLPYYPKRLRTDLETFARYEALVARSAPNLCFAGRLGCYRYLDMDQAIGSSLDLVAQVLRDGAWPRFSPCRAK